MAKDKEDLINTLRANVLLLKNKYEKEKEGLLVIQNEKSDLSLKLKNKEAECLSLEAKLDTIKMAKTLSGRNEAFDAKGKVSYLVRKIDKCIALLNR
jgi:predicted nuclease with TOPRIM domain